MKHILMTPVRRRSEERDTNNQQLKFNQVTTYHLSNHLLYNQIQAGRRVAVVGWEVSLIAYQYSLYGVILPPFHA